MLTRSQTTMYRKMTIGDEALMSALFSGAQGSAAVLGDRTGALVRLAALIAAGNALDFLRKGKAADGFIERHPGFSGADSEWTYLKPVLVNLAGAYNIDWASDPATWKPVRTSDKSISGTLAGASSP